jgi:PEP-CTERM motif-containing protein
MRRFYHSSIPLGCFLLACVLHAGAAAADTVTLYNTFGPGDGFETGVSNSFADIQEIGYLIVPSVTGRLDSLTVAIAHDPALPAAHATFSVRESIGGVPGNVLDSFAFHADGIFGSSYSPSTAFSTMHPTLLARSSYWITATTTGEQGLWNQSNQGVQAPFAIRSPGADWTVYPLRDAPAFRLTAQAPVPEPSTILLCGAGLTAVMIRSRRRSKACRQRF